MPKPKPPRMKRPRITAAGLDEGVKKLQEAGRLAKIGTGETLLKAGRLVLDIGDKHAATVIYERLVREKHLKQAQELRALIDKF